MSHKSTPSASESPSFTRTSVSIDEAIAILLGWTTGPVELQANNDDPSEGEEAEIDGYYFDLNYRLYEIREGLHADLSWAEHEGRQSDVERLRNELEQLKNYEANAFAYRCAIEDELNKGTESELRADKTRSNPAITYITLLSFDQWACKHYDLRFLTTPEQSSEGPLSPSTTEANKPLPRLREQEKAILACISALGYDPKQLPKNPSGMPGVKKEVLDKLNGKPPFEAKTAFKRAWDRLRDGDEIVDA